MEEFLVSIDQVKSEMKRGTAIFFLEVRPAADKDYAVMKVRGALRLTWDEVLGHLPEIPRERTVIVYSTAPNDQPGIQAARLLAQHGWVDVHVLKGGLRAYLNAGLAVQEIGEGQNMPRLRGL